MEWFRMANEIDRTAAYRAATSVLEKYGIDFCCGGKRRRMPPADIKEQLK
jgi:iron-sulfur cluster repair protein YtfE (RIC family)